MRGLWRRSGGWRLDLNGYVHAVGWREIELVPKGAGWVPTRYISEGSTMAYSENKSLTFKEAKALAESVAKDEVSHAAMLLGGRVVW